MRTRFQSTALLVFLIMGNLCPANGQDAIRLNQIGFYPGGPKYAVAAGTAVSTFYLASTDLSDTVFTGTLGPARTWSHSGETVKLANFGTFQTPGTYVLLIPDLGVSHPFAIGNFVHQSLTRGALRGYYFARASTALAPEFAGAWSRPAGHPDTQVRVHASAATASRPVNTLISAPKGWYDAGDYNKYIVNSGISTYTVLALYEHFPEYYRDFDLHIPESGNNLPDILDEALWNIRWMRAMQDPNDGGVYHKLTTANFSGVVMPHQATATRYVVQKSTPAALDFAAVMAQTARIFREFETAMPGFADSCLAAARAAWNWARQNPDLRYEQGALNAAFDPDIHTGEYGDGNFNDEFQWAAAELFITTREDSFLTAHIHPVSGSFGVPWWGGVNTLGLYSLAVHRAEIAGAVDSSLVAAQLLNVADRLRGETGNSAYHVAMGAADGDFVWGSNSVAANQGMLLIQAYRLTGDRSYRDAALQNLDYLLGRNGVGYCFVSGFGGRSPRHPHHRPSEADGVADPVPGLLAGGPNPGRQDGCPDYIGTERARAYVDSWCSYASNEIAINWNAPLVYLSGAIEALFSPTGEPTGIRNDKSHNKPQGFGLRQNYPNPFNPATRLTFTLPVRGEVTLRVFDIRGTLIRVLQHTTLPPGAHEVVWDSTTDTGAPVSSGVYIAKLNFRAPGSRWADAIKMTIIR